MSNELIDPNTVDSEQDAGKEIRVLNIDSLHLHSNDLDALNRLAQTDPALAKLVVEQKELADQREHASYRFGLLAAGGLGAAVVAALVFSLVYTGLVTTLAFIFGLMAVALLMRVLLTGEWSETSWVGHIVNGIVTALGGKPKD